jgi:hypothetical protein
LTAVVILKKNRRLLISPDSGKLLKYTRKLRVRKIKCDEVNYRNHFIDIDINRKQLNVKKDYAKRSYSADSRSFPA